MKDSYTVVQTLTWMEYFRLSVYGMFRTKMIRVIVSFVSIICVLGIFTDILLADHNNKTRLLSSILEAVGTPVIVILFFIVGAFLMTLLIAKFKPHIIRDITYRFTHWGMERSGGVPDISIPWRDIQSIRQTNNFFVINFKIKGYQDGYGIKKSNFHSSEELQEFMDFVTGKIINAESSL